MRLLCWAIFSLLLGSSSGWSLEEEGNVIVDKTLPNVTATDLLTEPIKRVRGKNEEKFSKGLTAPLLGIYCSTRIEQLIHRVAACELTGTKCAHSESPLQQFL